jgi:perosamine synthetase
MIPYARQVVDEQDVEAVARVLTSTWLTTGPKVEEFEEAVAERVGTKEAVAVSSGTAALHCAMHALGLGPGDEVIVPALTFVATANAVLYCGATPVFADVEADTLLLDPGSVREKITKATKAVITMDYAGQPSRYRELREIADKAGATLVADSCHALGARDQGAPVGSLARMSVFSFHPAKHITTGEGGMVTLDDANLARRIRSFRNHGIDRDLHSRAASRTFRYEMTELGFNYRLSDIQCALGLSQLSRLSEFLRLRREAAKAYDAAFMDHGLIVPLSVRGGVEHAYHLYVVRVDFDRAGISREEVYAKLLDLGIGVNVHYLPVHLQPYYRRRLGTGPGLCPVAEQAYGKILSLPMHAALGQDDVSRVVAAIGDIFPC